MDKILSALKNWKTIVTAIYALVITLGLMSAIYAWYGERNKPPVSQTVYIPTEQIKEVVKIKRVEVPVEKIVTIEKKVLVEKIKLPDWFLAETEQAIATGVIAPYEGQTNVIATLNTETGAGNIIAKQIPLPFMQFENKKEAGVRVGVTSDKLNNVSTVFGRWQFLRIGSTHLGLYGEANSGGEGVAQIELIYRF